MYNPKKKKKDGGEKTGKGKKGLSLGPLHRPLGVPCCAQLVSECAVKMCDVSVR